MKTLDQLHVEICALQLERAKEAIGTTAMEYPSWGRNCAALLELIPNLLRLAEELQGKLRVAEEALEFYAADDQPFDNGEIACSALASLRQSEQP